MKLLAVDRKHGGSRKVAPEPVKSDVTDSKRDSINQKSDTANQTSDTANQTSDTVHQTSDTVHQTSHVTHNELGEVLPVKEDGCKATLPITTMVKSGSNHSFDDVEDEIEGNLMVETASTTKEKRVRSGRNRLAVVLVILVVLLVLIIVLCLTVRSKAVLPVYQIIVPDSDTRDYRYIEIKNSLRATLVSDNTTTTASTSFNVAVGSSANPRDVLGLAHYLEHMLFMGTDKFPQENYADKFASDNDGYLNAWTDLSDTNYFFEVENSALKAMTDVFTQFFIKPLMKKESLEREMMAVQSEYMRGFSSDFWPEYQLIGANSNPRSPYSRLV